jgi:hypothetical protein
MGRRVKPDDDEVSDAGLVMNEWRRSFRFAAIDVSRSPHANGRRLFPSGKFMQGCDPLPSRVALRV